MTGTPDLLITGGTVVRADRSLRADVAVAGGRIEAIEPDLRGLRANARETVDATGLLVLPGAVDVHTHTRVASDAEPDRFFQDSVAAAFGGTTTFLAFNNPGTGSSPAAERSLLTGVREWRAATDGDSAIDVGLSLAISGRCDDPLAELPATIEAGVATSKAFMVFDFRLPDARLFEAMRVMGRHGGMLQVHCEDPVLLDAAVADALQRGDVLPRYHAATRPPFVEAVATARALAFARQAEAPVHVVHLSSAAALDEVRRAKAAGVRVSAETCPHYLTFTDAVYDEPDPLRCAAYVISPPLRSAEDRDALWAGLADGSLDLVATDHVPDRMAVEKGEAARGVPFDAISNGAPGIETLLAILYGEGVAKRPDHGRADGRPAVDHAGAAVRTGFEGGPRGRPGCGRRAVRPGCTPDDPRRGPPPHQRLHAVRGDGGRGAVRTVFVRGEAVIRDGQFVGRRGHGRFVERGPIGS